ncbi:hypothetical protein ADJ73_04085 [Arsenicicoccus sp. oral taxon 190]|nr:hypothetical protein ADJ73_04085 [Arsenicicoccus sp. oral taxon 190]
MAMLDNACRIEAQYGTKAAFPDGFAAFARAHGIPKATAYRHRERALREGSWQPRSRRPGSSPKQVPDFVAGRIVALRAGAELDEGADFIRAVLIAEAERDQWASKGLVVPARSTINQVLKRAGMLRTNPKKRPRSSYRRFAYARPRDCYQIDGTNLTGLGFGTGTVCIIEVLDDATRTLVAAHVCAAETSVDARAALTRAIAAFGAPGIVLSDNGAAFARHSRAGATPAPTKFFELVDRHGTRLIHSSPYHPQTCGKCERHHQTSKQWLTRRVRELTAAGHPPTCIADVQALVDQYQEYYNQRRWHSALNSTPAQAWAEAAARGDLGGPTRLPAQRDADIRAAKVSTEGRVRFGRLRFSVGRSRAGSTVTILVDGNHANVHDHEGTWIGHLTIDWDTTDQGRIAA